MRSLPAPILEADFFVSDIDSELTANADYRDAIAKKSRI